ARRRVERILGTRLPAGKKVILVATAGIDPDEQRWRRALRDQCAQQGELVLLHKPHPSLANAHPASDGSSGEYTLYRGPIEDALAVADLVVTDYSTVGVQAVLAGRRLITVNLTGRAFPANDYAALGVAVPVRRLEDLPAAIRTGLDQPDRRR